MTHLPLVWTLLVNYETQTRSKPLILRVPGLIPYATRLPSYHNHHPVDKLALETIHYLANLRYILSIVMRLVNPRQTLVRS